MSGKDAGISYSSSVDIEDGGPSISAISMTSSVLTITYHQNQLDAITSADEDSVEDDSLANLKVEYAGNGITFDYLADTDNYNNPSVTNVGYSVAEFTVGLEVGDADGSKKDSDEAVNTFPVGYTIGDITAKYSADDQSDQDWDVSDTYTFGDITVTAATDKDEAHAIKVATKLDAISLTAHYEVDGKSAGDTSENEVELG
jgi:hypothetical protein